MTILHILAFNIISVSAVIAAARLALAGASGWGWFLLIALLVAAVPASKSDDS